MKKKLALVQLNRTIYLAAGKNYLLSLGIQPYEPQPLLKAILQYSTI